MSATALQLQFLFNTKFAEYLHLLTTKAALTMLNVRQLKVPNDSIENVFKH